MTEQDKENLMKLLWRFNKEELDCHGNCKKCFYYMNSPIIGVDNCPILVAYDMIFRKTRDIDRWEMRIG